MKTIVNIGIIIILASLFLFKTWIDPNDPDSKFDRRILDDKKKIIQQLKEILPNFKHTKNGKRDI